MLIVLHCFSADRSITRHVCVSTALRRGDPSVIPLAECGRRRGLRFSWLSACARTVDLSHSSHAPSLRTHSPHPLHLSLVCATGLDCGRCGVPACMYGPIYTPVGADDSGLSACVPAMEKLRPDLRSAEVARLCCAPAACSLLGRFEQCSQSDLRSFQQPHDVQRTLVWSMACDGMT